MILSFWEQASLLRRLRRISRGAPKTETFIQWCWWKNESTLRIFTLVVFFVEPPRVLKYILYIPIPSIGCIYLHFVDFYGKLVGGFNPSEKFQSNGIISLSRDENKNVWNHHLVNVRKYTSPMDLVSILTTQKTHLTAPANITSLWGKPEAVKKKQDEPNLYGNPGKVMQHPALNNGCSLNQKMTFQ